MSSRYFLCITLLVASCGPPPSEDVDDRLARIELGTGRDTFERFEDGVTTMPLVHGPQGGYHFDVAVRFSNLDPEGLRLSYEVLDGTNTLSFETTFKVEPRFLRSQDGALLRLGDRVVLDIDGPEHVEGRSLQIVATAQLADGTTLADACTVSGL